jgi:hypothetical protein
MATNGPIRPRGKCNKMLQNETYFSLTFATQVQPIVLTP